MKKTAHGPVLSEHKRVEGFTLIELMVVITIMAILALAAFVFYTAAQRNARDAKRRQDIDAIATALETQKSPASIAYPKLSTTFFTSGEIPKENQTAVKYCMASFQLGSTDTNPPGKPTTWDKNIACPRDNETPQATYSVIDGLNDPPENTVFWTVCALLEGGYNNPSDFEIYCRFSAQ